MRKMNIRRKEILCKQMEMLAEKSTLATTDEIVKLSVAMCEIDKRLVHEQTAFMYPQDVNSELAKYYGSLMGKIDKMRDKFKKKFMLLILLQIFNLVVWILVALVQL